MKELELNDELLSHIVGGASGGGKQITCGVACALCATCNATGQASSEIPGARGRKKKVATNQTAQKKV